MVTNDGAVNFPCAVSFRTILDASSGRLMGVNVSVTDETAYVAQIEEIRRDKERLKKIEKLKDEFIAVASHELRSPIQPILGFAVLAKKKLMTEEAAWDGVLAEARRLQQLANDILDVSRIEAGSLKYSFKKEKMNELLQAIAESLRYDLPKEVELEFEHDESEAEVEIDRARISQVMNNLISNAAKFTEKGTITIATHMVNENQFEIRVIDAGRGISEEILPILFEKFATKGHGDVQNNKGTGLGLYISKAIIEAHSGKISAFNNDTGGATFVVNLPMSQLMT
jgi:signal transduction histidine kinase